MRSGESKDRLANEASAEGVDVGHLEKDSDGDIGPTLGSLGSDKPGDSDDGGETVEGGVS